MIKNKEQSLWFKMLDSKISSKLDKSGNVFIFGEPLCGKKKLITGIQEYAKNKTYDRRKNFDADWDKRDLDKVYIMDFKYMSVKQKREGDGEIDEIGKINFYIFNKKYEFIKDFLTKEMLHNLVIVIVLDLDDPQGLKESFDNWLEFAQKSIYSFISDLPEETQAEYKQNFVEMNKKMQQFGTYLTSTKVKVKVHAPKDTIKEDPLEDQAEEVVESEPEEEESIRIPLVVIGNKSDVIDSVGNDSLKDHLDHTLRQINIENSSILFTVSSKNDWNLNLVTQFFMYILLDRPPEESADTKENFNLVNMFVKSESDSLERLKNSFPNYEPYTFRTVQPVLKKDFTVEQSEMKTVTEFLAELNNGTFLSANEQEETSRPGNLGNSMIGGNSRNTLDMTSSMNKKTDKIRDIIGKKV